MWPFNRVKELENQLLKVTDQRDNLRAKLDTIKDNKSEETLSDINKSSFSFDWKNGNAFSIERISYWSKQQEIWIPTTIIGYYAPNPTEENPNATRIGEWYFHCSLQEHERLVKDFNAYQSKRK